MTHRKKIVIYIILFLSLLFNAIVISLDVYPYASNKLKEKYFKDKTIGQIDNNTENLILNKSLEMASSSKVAMVWDEPQGITNEIISLNSKTASDKFRTFNYPRAFLLDGIVQFASKRKNTKALNEVKIIFDDLIDVNGKPKFVLDKVDQIPFGLASLKLYEEFGEVKYLSFAKFIFRFITTSVDADGLLPYRKGQNKILNDVLGMSVPFLLEFAKIDNNENALNIARQQLTYYVHYGVDKETFLPTHAVNREEKIKIGPVNWGRGVGWYFIALSTFHKETGEFDAEYKGIVKTLLSIKNSEKLWSQFPGSDDVFDASSSTLFIYAILLNKPNFASKKDILELLKPYLSVEGEILHTSGDTYALNRYSNTFGESELSQGLLLLILSLY